jgi:hypothetical protein
MTMLTHHGVPFEQASHSPGQRKPVGAGAAASHLAMVKRFCMVALTLLAAGATLTAIMALKIAIYLPRFIHH